MKAVVLAGGLGSRLLPMTRVTNKHLLPVFDRPMIHFPIQQRVHAGIDEILTVTGGNNAGDFLKLLGNGREFGLKGLHYTYQELRPYADNGPLCVILGDNIFGQPIKPAVDQFRANPEGAMVMVKEVEDPERFGVAEFQDDRVVGIEEKPAQPRSNFAVIGCYFYDSHVFEAVRGLNRSARGELEISGVNNRYVRAGDTPASSCGWLVV